MSQLLQKVIRLLRGRRFETIYGFVLDEFDLFDWWVMSGIRPLLDWLEPYYIKTREFFGIRCRFWCFFAGYWFAFGRMLFYAIDGFGTGRPVFKNIFGINYLIDIFYFVWEGGFAVLAMCLVVSFSNRSFKIFWPILLFTIIRLCILTSTTIIQKIDRNLPIITAALFSVALLGVLYISFQEISERRRLTL